MKKRLATFFFSGQRQSGEGPTSEDTECMVSISTIANIRPSYRVKSGLAAAPVGR